MPLKVVIGGGTKNEQPYEAVQLFNRRVIRTLELVHPSAN